MMKMLACMVTYSKVLLFLYLVRRHSLASSGQGNEDLIPILPYFIGICSATAKGGHVHTFPYEMAPQDFYKHAKRAAEVVRYSYILARPHPHSFTCRFMV